MSTIKTAAEQDKEIISRCDREVRHRRSIELKIVRETLRQLRGVGMELAADNGEDQTHYGVIDQELIENLFATDEAQLLTRAHGVTPSFVYFVFGNDGYDVISDYGVSLEGTMEKVMKYVDGLEDSGQ